MEDVRQAADPSLTYKNLAKHNDLYYYVSVVYSLRSGGILNEKIQHQG